MDNIPIAAAKEVKGDVGMAVCCTDNCFCSIFEIRIRELRSGRQRQYLGIHPNQGSANSAQLATRVVSRGWRLRLEALIDRVGFELHSDFVEDGSNTHYCRLAAHLAVVGREENLERKKR